MSDRTENVRINHYINNAQAQSALQEQQKEYSKLRDEQKKMTAGSKEWLAKQKDIDQVTKKMMDFRKSMDITSMSLKQLNNHAKLLRNIQQHLIPGTREANRMAAELRRVDAQITRVRTGLGPFGQMWRRLGTEIKAFGVMALAAMGFQALWGKMGNLISQSGELSDSLANVQRLTGMTADEVANLNSVLGKVDTRTSRKELLSMAAIAGQFGVAKKDIAGFVQAMDQINVVMGGEFGGNVEEVATTLAKLRNVLTDTKTGKIDEDLTHIGNALTVLAQEGVATAPVVSDFANRIAGIGIPLGLTSDEILGLSATMQELNISVERGGTAIGKILQKMFSNVGEFAKIAGMPVKEFEELLNTDLMGAFTKVLEGTKTLGVNSVELAGIIKDLEVQGAGASEVLAKLGGNTDMLGKKITLAGKSLKETNAITEQFALQNETLGAKIEKLQKRINTWLVSSALTGALKDAVEWMYKLGDGIDRTVSESMVKERMELIKVEMKLKDVNLKHEDRIKLINTLKENYPDYFKNLNAETATNQELSRAIKSVNDELINKIVLQKKNEELDAENENAAEKKLTMLDKEDVLRTKMAKAMEKHTGFRYQENKTLSENAKLLEDYMGYYDDYSFLLTDLKQAMEGYQRATWASVDADAAANNMLAEKGRLMKQLGIVDASPATGVMGVEKTPATIAAEKAAAEKLIQDEKTKVLIAEENRRLKITEAKGEETYAIKRRIMLLELSLLEKATEEYKDKINDIAVLDLQHLQERKKADDKFKADALSAEEKNNSEVERMMKKLNAQLDAEDEKHAKAKQALSDKEQRRLMARAELEVLLAKQGGRDRLNAEIAMMELERDFRLKEVELTEEERALIEEKFAQARMEMQVAFAQKQYQKVTDIASRALEDISRVAQKFTDVKTNHENAAFDQYMRNNDVERLALQDRLDKGIISQKQYDKRMAEIDKEQAIRKYELDVAQFERQKSMAITMAIIQGSLAVVNAWAEGGWVENIIETVAIVALTAGEIAVIESQPPPVAPVFKYGKMGGKVRDGKSHEKGGINMVDPVTGELLGNMEVNESIIPEATTNANPDIISALLNNYGKRLTPQSISGAIPQFNFGRASENLLLEKGRAFATTTSTRVVNNAGAKESYESDLTKYNAAMLAEMRAFRKELQQKTFGLSLFDLNRAQSDKTKVEDLNRMK